MNKQSQPMTTQTDILVYQRTNSSTMKVLTDRETVWLTVDQMASLFGRDKSVIGKHVRNVFAEGELEGDGFRQILPKTPLGGRPEAIYSLDVIISVAPVRGDILQTGWLIDRRNRERRIDRCAFPAATGMSPPRLL